MYVQLLMSVCSFDREAGYRVHLKMAVYIILSDYAQLIVFVDIRWTLFFCSDGVIDRFEFTCMKPKKNTTRIESICWPVGTGESCVPPPPH